MRKCTTGDQTEKQCLNTDESLFVLLGTKDKHNVHQAIRTVVKAIRHKNASKEASMTEATQVMPTQSPRGAELEKRSRKVTIDSYEFSRE